MTIRYVEGATPPRKAILSLYKANGWSSADKPALLMKALEGSDHLVTAHQDDRLVGLANAISDGHMVVYYPHLLVHPDAQGTGIGRELMARMVRHYEGFHQHMLVAVAEAAGFYESVGFSRAGETVSMWIYDGDDA